MVKEIPLTGGYVAQVDDSDYEFLMRFKWSAYRDGTNTPRYARHGVSIDGKYYGVPMHRLIMAAPPGVEVDHRNGDGFDNRRANLRFASRFENARNIRAKNGHLKGARPIGKSAWGCYIRVDGELRYFGAHRSREFAAKVYDAAARRLYGEFAATNFDDIDPEADAIAAAVIAGNRPPKPQPVPRRLTDADVIAIRTDYASGRANGMELASRYGVCPAAIYHAIRGRTFAHLPGAIPEDKRGVRRDHDEEAA